MYQKNLSQIRLFLMFHYSSNFCFAVERLFDDGLRSQGVNYHLKSRRKCPLIKNDKKLFLNKIVMFPPTNRYYMCPKALIIRQISSKNGNRYLLTLSFRNLIIMLAYYVLLSNWTYVYFCTLNPLHNGNTAIYMIFFCSMNHFYCLFAFYLSSARTC